METQVIKVNPRYIDLALIKKAAECIRKGGLVAFPTETVYGLGANALDQKAVRRVFDVKNRPLDDPLIVHISDITDLYKLTKNVPTKVEKLVKYFWPGPLTIVLEKKDKVPSIVTAGLDTIAIRMPSNAIAKKLIRLAGVPVAAPSANMFGRSSPTTSEHVLDDLDGKVDIVLDGGRTHVGVESTVVSFKNDRLAVLRPGGISIEELENVLHDVKVSKSSIDIASSPGKYKKHYSPHAKLILVENDNKQVRNVLRVSEQELHKGNKVIVLAKKEHARFYSNFLVKILGPEKNDRLCASRLFHLLRECDKENADIIVVEGIPERGLGLAVMNRLRKASSKIC